MKTRKTRIAIEVVVTMLLVIFTLPTFGQTSHTVDVTNNKFTPKTITIDVGDTVVWTNSEGRHNVNGKQEIFTDNPISFGNEVGSGWTYKYVFTLAGTYDYQCDPHVGLGMVGQVVVGGATSILTEENSSFLRVYPNPAKNHLQISDKELKNRMVNLSIFNSLGQQVDKRTIESANGEIYLDIETIPRGLYILKIQSLKYNVQGRFFKD